MTRVLKVGDRVVFDDDEYQVAGVSGTMVRLVNSGGEPLAVSLVHLVASDGFRIVGGGGAARSPGGLAGHGLDDLPREQAELARFWERHLVELETGLPPGGAPDGRPRPEYDPGSRPLSEREAAKAAELTAAGTPTSVRTVQRMRARYRSGGVRGLVDGRSARSTSVYGRTDERVVDAIRDALDGETRRSTGTRDRLRLRVEAILAERHGDGVVGLPSKATFNRLVAAMSTGRHTFGAATTRRSAANRPAGPFTATWASRPGQHVQIDTTPLDVLAVFDDGIARRIELTAGVDVATRTITAGVLRPMGTKAVDASLLLARMLVPEPMRPGWAEALRMSVSRLPHRSLADIDARMEQAAAKPVIVPETIGCDRGKVFLSETFVRSCETLGISLQPSHPRTPTDDSVIERTFQSINTLFCQHVAGYTGRDVTRRGAAVESEAVWSLAQLQDLFDEWVIHWQRRPHEGLLSPDTGRACSPNEMYAVLVSAAGYLPLMLTGEDYLELLPSHWRTINDYGVRIDRRTYDDRALNPYRRQHSGVTARGGAWEVRYDPYDLTQVFVRNHHDGGWIRAAWTHLPMVSAPFADFTWRHARQIVADSGRTEEPVETAAARALADLLDRASAGPDTEPAAGTKADRKVAARTRAATPHRPSPEPVDLRELDDDDDFDEDGGDDGELGTVIPFGVFDAAAEAERWL
ncbi:MULTISPECIES: Mu transposase C-terminal domain-containing protein [Rhodococcus]|uniref:Mu transposase C-terminal domain-containing protein n=1 Tax=Rhodococcus TaxID=1827 RepID=UPI0029554C6B|nr:MULTISPECIES: Mu transposase C-terminal domain-containing protein [Rhodococcus]MDV7246274.1 Mu transposase C-terminal domain-containing protein [Rhodococcus oxybenzonivorans]MDV7337254.1 Mu transposase C-terminal domain-containing protein [Rhodococcus oxybenzonivorans]MDV8030806.1 Mu transposase C-terminal domain-containing protein [Rhodococcus sp. IEGM 27]